MEAKTVLKELKALGNPGYRKILLNHGAQSDCFGVKIPDVDPSDLTTVKQAFDIVADLAGVSDTA